MSSPEAQSGSYDEVEQIVYSFIDMFPERCRFCPLVGERAVRLAVEVDIGKLTRGEAVRLARESAIDVETNCPTGLIPLSSFRGDTDCGYPLDKR